MTKIPHIDRSRINNSAWDKADYGFVFSDELPKSRHRESNKKYYDKRKRDVASR